MFMCIWVYTTLHRAVLYYDILYYTVLYSIPYYTILYYYSMLYYIMLLIGGLLNATFGNAVEMILSVFALKEDRSSQKMEIRQIIHMCIYIYIYIYIEREREI